MKDLTWIQELELRLAPSGFWGGGNSVVGLDNLTSVRDFCYRVSETRTSDPRQSAACWWPHLDPAAGCDDSGLENLLFGPVEFLSGFLLPGFRSQQIILD